MNRTAVVLGASIAGMAAARVLADHFDRVIVLEHDDLVSGPRKGVPQSDHTHVLLQRGERVLESLFPGLRATLLDAGAKSIDWGSDVRWYHFGGWKQRHEVDFRTVACSRSLLERSVRERFLELPGVELRTGVRVRGLFTDRSGRRIAGVHLGGSQRLEGELVVDATGRSSKTSEWLEELGFPRPREIVVNSFIGYATRRYRKPAAFDADWSALLIHPTPPTSSRFGVIFGIEDDEWSVTLVGVNEDYPPTDPEGFERFAKELATDELHQALLAAEPLTRVRGYRRTANRMLEYHRVPRHLEGLVVCGDAMCAFNPVYGQGISMAAVSAETLGMTLSAHRGEIRSGFARTFFRRMGKRLTIPWFLATTEDYRYPGTVGGKPAMGARALQRYVDGLIRSSVQDADSYARFLRILHLVSGPEILLDPRSIFRVLLK